MPDLGGRVDVAVIGGGIVGLSAALHLMRRRPGASVVVLEKEHDVATHQSGRNSGVIHSGLYYRPGSLKASMARAGAASMVAFCAEHGIAYEVCGKLVVATRPDELAGLEALHRRGLDNGLAVRRLGAGEAQDLEPHVPALAALHVPTTGIVDFAGVARRYAELFVEAGGRVHLGAGVRRVDLAGATHRVTTDAGELEAGFVVNCAGLHADRVARMVGVEPGARIVPFRGEYFEVVGAGRALVRNLVYPVPDPAFPFLGVHLTRGIDGGVHAGPNAVLALRREGYGRTDVGLRDVVDVLGYEGFRRLAARHWREGAREVWRSVSRRAFLRSLQRLVPELTADDLVAAPSGVRAQALRPDGSMVDDFLFADGPHSLHVLNAPSPAATASIEVGRAIAARVPPD